jgi:hypothetical protein
MSNRDKVNEEMSLVESAAKCGRPEVLSAAMKRLLLSPQFTGRVCVVVQDGRVLRQEISAESILAGTTVVAMGSGVSSRTRKAKQKAKAKERDQTRQGNAGAQADARPEIAGEPDRERVRRGCGLRQPGGSGEWGDEAGGWRRFGNRRWRETFCWERSAGEQGANAETSGGSIVE